MAKKINNKPSIMWVKPEDKMVFKVTAAKKGTTMSALMSSLAKSLSQPVCPNRK